MSDKRFRIALSFAGEKRDFVSKVANILAQHFGQEKILYDKFHEAEFANWKLGLLLQEHYHDHSDLIVVVICPDYSQKEWCGLEWVAIHGMLMSGKDREIMLCRFNCAKLQGINENAGFVELDDKTPEQTAILILERLAINEGCPKDHYTNPISASPAVLKTCIPNNLPRIQPFFGREKELAAIREALAPENRTWGALIDGPGGIGKTSLAIRAAYDCPPGLFERIIFLSAKSREMDEEGERPLTGFILSSLIEMLNELARELGQPDINKSPEDQRILLLLQALQPVQVLLIFDNLESIPKSDCDQLFNLVKRLPQGCKAIITSRRRIGSGSELVQVDKLEEDAALATLADLAKHNKLLAKTNGAERHTLYEQTGGNPLLLRWLAGQLGRGSCRTFTDAINFLNSCPPNNDPLEFIFGDLVEEFTPEETSVLCTLAYFNLPAKVAHIAKVSSLNKDLAETALRRLANRSLVVPDQEEQSFSLVPMVAVFLRRKRPEVVAETGCRLEKRAYALIVESGYEKHTRFPALDAAWPSLAAALPLFLAGPNDRLQTVCSAIFQFLNFTGRWDESLSLSRHAETKAIMTIDYDNAGHRAYQAGWIHNLRQQADEVLACSKRAEGHWHEAKAGARERATAINLRGFGYRIKKDYPAAIEAYRESLDLFRSLSTESVDIAKALNDLANAERESGDFATAERDYREVLRVTRAVGHDEGIATCTGNLAALELDREDWPGAEALAREALSLSKKLGRQELIAAHYCLIAKALAQQGKKAEGLPYAQRAVKIFTELGSPQLKTAREIIRECEE